MDHSQNLWYFNINEWNPTKTQWEICLNSLPDNEKRRITQFYFDKDKKLGLISQLIQRKLINYVFNVSFDKIKIEKTIDNKPYFVSELLPFWNFNVSHQDKIVVAISDPNHSVGIDVMSMTERLKKQDDITSHNSFFKSFEQIFTTKEWECINSHTNIEKKYYEFCRFWSMKEAYVKAIGKGLGFDLGRIEVDFYSASTIHIKIDGHSIENWSFLFFENLPENHVVSIAFGPYHDDTSTYKRQYSIQDDSNINYNTKMPNEWKKMTITDLIPNEKIQEYLVDNN